jgi:hypothetical protein
MEFSSGITSLLNKNSSNMQLKQPT